MAQKSISIVGLATEIAEAMENIPAIEFKNKKIALVRSILESGIEKIKEITDRGDRVTIKEFGRFEKRHRSARQGHNPQNPEEVVNIDAKDVLGFKSNYTFDNAE